MKRRVLGLILTLVMVLALIPATVFAGNAPAITALHDSASGVEKIDNLSDVYYRLKGAATSLAALLSGDSDALTRVHVDRTNLCTDEATTSSLASDPVGGCSYYIRYTLTKKTDDVDLSRLNKTNCTLEVTGYTCRCFSIADNGSSVVIIFKMTKDSICPHTTFVGNVCEACGFEKAPDNNAYAVWVNGVRVMDSNRSDVLGDGKVSYEPAKAELTLENAAITKRNSEANSAGIYSYSDISIVLKGENTIHSDNGGIYAGGDITTSGGGSLQIESKDRGIYGVGVTIAGEGLVRVSSTDSTAISSTRTNICGTGNLQIDNKYSGIYAQESLTISGQQDVQIISSESDGISAGSVNISGSGDMIVFAKFGGVGAGKDLVVSGNRNLMIIANSGMFSSEKLTLSGSGEVTVVTGGKGISGNKSIEISGSGKVTVASENIGATSNGNLILSGSGDVDIYGKQKGVWVTGSSQVLLNGSSSSIEFSADSGYTAVYNYTTPVAGTHYHLYEVTGDPTSNSVTYTLKAPYMPFVDVKEGDFFYNPVLWAVKNNITNGVDATHFGPGNDCLRAQVVTFLWRAAGQPEPKTTNNPFVDVKSSDFFYKPVLWAVEKGITSGMDATHFGPMEKCNRAQVVTFLYRAAGSPKVSGSNPFADVPAGAFYEAPVLWAVQNGITNGMDATHFGPGNICNRAQIVTFLYRAYN